MSRPQTHFVADLHDRHTELVVVGRCNAGPVLEMRRFGRPITRFVAGPAQVNKIRAKAGRVSITDKAIQKAQTCVKTTLVKTTLVKTAAMPVKTTR